MVITRLTVFFSKLTIFSKIQWGRQAFLPPWGKKKGQKKAGVLPCFGSLRPLWMFSADGAYFSVPLLAFCTMLALAEIYTSTRRFWARPAGVSLLATG